MFPEIFSDKMLLDIKDRLDKMNVRALWNVAREVGVPSPTDGKSKEQNIELILAIATCELVPVPKAKRGAPPKSCEYDKELVTDIKSCMDYYALIKSGAKIQSDKLEVSDGTDNQVCEGILVKTENEFFIRTNGCLPNADDVYVREYLVNKFRLKEGDVIKGEYSRKSPEEFAVLTKIYSVDGYSPDLVPRREFTKLTPIYPNKRIQVANSGKDIAARMIDLFAPVGYGQRAVISTPESIKMAIIKQIIREISLDRELDLAVVFMVAGNPEEITDIERSSDGVKVFGTTFELERNQHEQAAEFVATYCKNAAERGENVILIVDGLSKLESYAKRLLSSAICAEEGGSLTVIATVSAPGEYSSEYSAELLSAANMRTVLTYSNHTPQIDLDKSYTLNCEFLQTERELKAADALRKQYKTSGNSEEVLTIFKNTKNNVEIVKQNG